MPNPSEDTDPVARELLAFLESTRASTEAATRAVDCARQAGRDDLVEVLERWEADTGKHLGALRQALSASGAPKPRAPEEKKRDVVDEASWESFPASDPPAY